MILLLLALFALPARAATDIADGNRYLTQSSTALKKHGVNRLNCTSCHLNGGLKAGAISWFRLGRSYPQYRPRAGKQVTLADRVNECMERSLNGHALALDSHEMKAILAYFGSVEKNAPKEEKLTEPGLRHLTITTKPDREHGHTLYTAKCAVCHGTPTETGAVLGENLAGPPLWGEGSFNIGAGMARLGQAEAFIRSNMPLGQDGSLSPQEARDVADYVIHLPRPDFALKAQDWPKGGKPADARY